MKTRLLYTEIWQDDFFSALNPSEKLLYVYYLTNDSVNIIHLYRCLPSRVSADTGIDTPIVIAAQQKFEQAGKIFFKNGYVYLKNAHRFESYVGEKNEVAKDKLFSRLSDEIIDWYNKITDRGIDRGTMIGTRNKKSETLNKKYLAEQVANDFESSSVDSI